MTAVLVDLDGTITDSASGIIKAYRHTLATLGIEPPPPEEMRWIVGPPARQCLPKLLGEEHDVESAVRQYRSYYAENGLFDATVYDGMHDSLAALRERVDRLFICTAKPVAFARRILAHFEVAPFFDGVYGAEFDGRFDDKGELIDHLLREEGVDPQAAVMVGDRRSDVLAATRNKVRSVGVTWGYGGAEELSSAGATVLCHIPTELPAAVDRAFTEPHDFTSSPV